MFTKKILNGKLHFLCSVLSGSSSSLEAIVTSFLPPLLLGLLERKANFMEEEPYTVLIGFVLTKSFSLPTLLFMSLLKGALSVRELTC